MSKQQEGNFGSRTRKKRRRSKTSGVEDRVHDVTEDNGENEISDRRDQSSRKRNDPFPKSRPRSREARKSRAERRRRKKKERKERNRGSGKSSRQNDKRQDVELRSSKREGTDTSKRSIEKSSNVTADRLTSLAEVVDGATTWSSLQRHSTLEATKRLTRTTPRRGVYVADTVEREFSKQLEMEISKSTSKDLSILDDGIFDSPPKKSTGRDVEWSEVDGKSMDENASSNGKIDFGNSRYDAERMLGYSRTKEDLPILDLENEVLERTLKDYNAYMSRLKPALLARESPPPIPRTSGPHPPRKPIINSDESDDEETSTEVTGMMRDDSTSGDLSCINGTFLPAPLSRHALIKYVK